MQHPVSCSRCNCRFMHGVTRVRRFIVFHFCAPCQIEHFDDCERIMAEVAAPISSYPRKTMTTVAGVMAAAMVVLASVTGCAVQQPVARGLAQQTARLAIPVSCIDKVVSGTHKTKCVARPDGTADCNHVVIRFHCTKVVPQQ